MVLLLKYDEANPAKVIIQHDASKAVRILLIINEYTGIFPSKTGNINKNDLCRKNIIAIIKVKYLIFLTEFQNISPDNAKENPKIKQINPIKNP